MLKETISTFSAINRDINLDKDLIVVDNSSTDGTVKFLKKSNYNIILNSSNLGAQSGKMIGWKKALDLGYEYILFIEDDFPSINPVNIDIMESFLLKHEDVGYIRLNDKKYLKKHVITKRPIAYSNWFFYKGIKIRTSNYNFTTNPVFFRASLVEHFLKYGKAKSEKDYMRWYMDKYDLQAHMKPHSFKTIIKKRREDWIR
tara:strand:- start:963 stop:1565 length:603 start_codon:yes stop_codon:yes gene_type:complete